MWTNCYGVCVAVKLKFPSDGLDMAQTVSSHVFIDLFSQDSLFVFLRTHCGFTFEYQVEQVEEGA